MAIYGSSNAANIAASSRDAASAYNTLEDGPITTFLDKLKDWKFNFPANNLWTVNILMHNDGSEKSHTLANLYTNILKANGLFNAQVGSTWEVKNSSNQDFGNDFITKLGVDKTGLFLANGVSYETHKATLNTNTVDEIAAYGGFLTWGVTNSTKNPGQNCKIQFLETNWNIGNILFDKWIAAIMQQGLIEDSSLPNIKADILIYKYAPSLPANLYNSKSANKSQWQLKEIIKLIKAVPLSHEGDSDLDYNTPNGVKTVTVQFTYQDYTIEYVV